MGGKQVTSRRWSDENRLYRPVLFFGLCGTVGEYKFLFKMEYLRKTNIVYKALFFADLWKSYNNFSK
jgi:hypothetical protein